MLEFLAHRITTNVRVLEGALTRLFAFASLVGREITLELAQDCLADILRASDRKLTIEEIQRKVAEHYNIRLSDMIGPKRLRNIARPRQVAMYLAKQLTPRSLPEIGRRFGGPRPHHDHARRAQDRGADGHRQPACRRSAASAPPAAGLSAGRGLDGPGKSSAQSDATACEPVKTG